MADQKAFTSLMPIKRSGTLPPLFCMHGEPVKLARLLAKDRPVYALNYVYETDAYHLSPNTMEGLARSYIRDLRQVQATGPYYLFGFSAGATIAYEMARQLQNGGFTVAHLCLVEPMLNAQGAVGQTKMILGRMRGSGFRDMQLGSLWRVIAGVVKRRPRAIWNRIRTVWYRRSGRLMPARLRWVNYLAHIQPAASTYQYRKLRCPIDLVYRDLGDETTESLREFWHAAANEAAKITVIGSTREHLDLMSDEALGAVAAILDAQLRD